MPLSSGIQPPQASAGPARISGSVCPVDVSHSPHARLRTASATRVGLNAGLWRQRATVNREVSLKHAYDMFEEAGHLCNLRLAAGQGDGEYCKGLATDSDVYKWIEAVAYELAHKSDVTLERLAHGVIETIMAAQMDDGYLMSFYQVVKPERRWMDIALGHELYCAGHLLQAAIAYHAATDDDRLLGVADRLVNHLVATFGEGRRSVTPGHPGIEMALVEFYRYTGRDDCLALARDFIDRRGRFAFDGVEPWVFQNHAPVTEQSSLVGHAVRQMYLVAGVADLYLETGDGALLDVLQKQWREMVAGKIYITGGLGQRHHRETFGEAYELPSDRCYCESCAAVGGIMWNWRMLLATGEARFADLIEQTLYNGFLSAGGIDGKQFFYVNPLMSRGEPKDSGDDRSTPWHRKPWHKTACCPPNIMRLLASLEHYLVTTDDRGIQIQQYASCSIDTKTPASGAVRLDVETRYPWDGDITIAVDCSGNRTWSMTLRIPAWCENFKLSINGKSCNATNESGYVVLTRSWQSGDVVQLHLEMRTLQMVGDPRVDAVRGSVAIQRGPVLYCLEQCDCPTNVDLRDIVLADDPCFEAAWMADLLGGVVAIQLNGYQRLRRQWNGVLYRPLAHHDKDESDLSGPIRLRAIPYFAWANRVPSNMQVWIPREQDN